MNGNLKNTLHKHIRNATFARDPLGIASEFGLIATLFATEQQEGLPDLKRGGSTAQNAFDKIRSLIKPPPGKKYDDRVRAMTDDEWHDLGCAMWDLYEALP